MPHTTDATNAASHWRLIGAVLLGLALSIFLSASPADADHCSSSNRLDRPGAEVSADCHGQAPGRQGARTSSEEDRWNAYCTYIFDGPDLTLPYVDGALARISYTGQLDQDEVARRGYDPTGVYGRFTVLCDHPSGRGGVGGPFDYTITDPVPLEVLRDRAKARISLDDPPVDSNPSFTERFTIVRIPTWLWVDEGYWTQDTFESESSGFVTVEVWAEPVDLRWSFSGGAPEVDCPEGPGRPWVLGAGDPECSVLFRQSSAGERNDAFASEATVDWQFYWSLNGADQGPFDDLLDLTTGFEIQVGEIQSVET